VSRLERAILAGRQAELVAALVDGGTPPTGFDAARMDTLAAALRAKRERAIERAWPRLARALGPDWPETLAWHVREVPAPPASGGLGDGRLLARRLAAVGRLPWDGRLELLAVELRWRWPADGRRLSRRFGFAVAAAGRRPWRVCLAVRAGGREWWWQPIRSTPSPPAGEGRGGGDRLPHPRSSGF
jgi:hypothetical protein